MQRRPSSSALSPTFLAGVDFVFRECSFSPSLFVSCWQTFSVFLVCVRQQWRNMKKRSSKVRGRGCLCLCDASVTSSSPTVSTSVRERRRQTHFPPFQVARLWRGEWKGRRGREAGNTKRNYNKVAPRRRRRHLEMMKVKPTLEHRALMKLTTPPVYQSPSSSQSFPCPRDRSPSRLRWGRWRRAGWSLGTARNNSPPFTGGAQCRRFSPKILVERSRWCSLPLACIGKDGY